MVLRRKSHFIFAEEHMDSTGGQTEFHISNSEEELPKKMGRCWIWGPSFRVGH